MQIIKSAGVAVARKDLGENRLLKPDTQGTHQVLKKLKD